MKNINWLLLALFLLGVVSVFVLLFQRSQRVTIHLVNRASAPVVVMLRQHITSPTGSKRVLHLGIGEMQSLRYSADWHGSYGLSVKMSNGKTLETEDRLTMPGFVMTETIQDNSVDCSWDSASGWFTEDFKWRWLWFWL